MSRYFSRFPLVDYNGAPAKNILARVDFTDEAKRDIYSNFDYVIQDDLIRPDFLSYTYYDSSQYDWMIYLSNSVIDPYHDYYLSADDFEKYIIGKYGTLASAREKTLFYRNDWAADESLITEATYESLEASIKKYWKPRLGANNQIAGYERVKEDWTVSTNKILELVLSANVAAFDAGDIISQSSTEARATVVSIDTTRNSVIVQHVEEEFEVSVGEGLLEINTLKVNIPTTENAFWSRVSAYDYEQEKNELKRYINLIKKSYLPEVEKLFIEQLKS
jgi:hypothetical protein